MGLNNIFNEKFVKMLDKQRNICLLALVGSGVCFIIYTSLSYDPQTPLLFNKKYQPMHIIAYNKIVNQQKDANKPMLVDFHLEFKSSNNISTDVQANGSKYIISLSEALFKPNSIDLSNCVYSNCLVTTDTNLFPKSAAVIFDKRAALGQVSSRELMLRETRPPNQVWIFISHESCINMKNEANPFRHNVFNWSMTYRRDSEIPFPWGMLKKRPLPPKDYHQLFTSKTKFAAWIVSNCQTPNKRMDYVKLLQRYVPVDIFGRCSKTRDKISFESIPDLLKNYKFYLSFENSNCYDYLTEKVMQRWNSDLILIVRGGANYSELLPVGTYINTNDFNNVKELAQFLIYLNSTEQAYMKYFHEKSRYYSVKDEGKQTTLLSWKNAMCTICRNLNNLDKYRHVYKDTLKWYHKNNCHRPTDIIPE